MRGKRKLRASASAVQSGFAAVLLLICLSSLGFAQNAVPPPLPVMPIPTARQLEWQQRELAMFVHFTVNTFTNREWGDGAEDPAVFDPSEFDVDQWVKAAQEFGFRSIILTAKHHDGFCLWPSRFTDHSVRSSPWRDGHGDVVAELAGACRRAGIRLGLYLSPWDRHEPSYGNELKYNLYYLGQLRELLTRYGPLSEVWFDGAKGEDARGMNYYFKAYWALVRQLQPGAVIFSDEGPDVRWIGNERGSAGESCWSMLDRSRVSVGNADTAYLNRGDPDGPQWVPGETDVSIRKGWFWHPDQQPKSVEELLDIYFHSVGRNSVLLLNVPPDNRGRLPETDVRRLREFRRALDSIFDTDLARGATGRADNVRGGSPDFGMEKTLDGQLDSYWATDDAVRTAWVEYDLGKPRRFNVCRLQEPIELGQRVKSYRLEVETSSGWRTVSEGTTIGYKKLDRFEAVEARRVRLRILDSRACPLLAEFGLYFEAGRQARDVQAASQHWKRGTIPGLAFVFSLGPRMPGGLSLPLALVYKVVPVLGQFRATARFAFLVVVAVSVLAAFAVARLRSRPFLVGGLIVVILLEYFPVGLQSNPCAKEAFSPRPVDIWLRQQNPVPAGPPGDRRPRQRERKVLLELPDYSGTDQWPKESLYMLYSTHHWMNLVNGYTRFYPPEYASDFRIYSRFPESRSIRFMRERGIDFVVAHLSAFDEVRRKEILSAPGLVKRFGDDCVFDLTSSTYLSEDAESKEERPSGGNWTVKGSRLESLDREVRVEGRTSASQAIGMLATTQR